MGIRLHAHVDADVRSGQLRSHEVPGRPIRLAIWFPAIAGTKLMPVEGYLRPPAPPAFTAFNKFMIEKDIGSGGRGARGLFRTEKYYQEMLATPSGAYQGAAPRAGKFPMVIYALGQGDHNLENPVLAEFLASHGYVVASVPSLGPDPLRADLLINDPQSFDAQVRDLQFAVQRLHSFPNSDPTKLALVGMSMGGLYTLIAATQMAPSVNAIVGLDASIWETFPSYAYKYSQARSFDRAHVKIPILELHRAGAGDTSNVLDSLIYADRYTAIIPSAIHVDFNSFPFLTAPERVPITEVDSFALSVRNQETGVAIGRAIDEAVLRFLDATVKHDARAMNAIRSPSGLFDPKRSAKIAFFPGVKGPTETELVGTLLAKGEPDALRLFEQTMRAYAQTALIRESRIERIGNELSYGNRNAESLAVFKLNAKMFRDSLNAARLSGDALLQSGDTVQAVSEYRRALKIAPQDSSLRVKINVLEAGRNKQ